VLEGPLYGLDVKYVLGMTDIDDKIIARAEEQAQAQGAQAQQSQEGDGNGWLALARRHEAGFLADMSALGVAPPTALARVTEHIPEIRGFIARIVDNGMAYLLPGDGVYFDTGAFEGREGRYGKLGGGAAASARGGGGGGGGGGGAVDEDAAASGSAADGGVAAADGVAAAGAKRDPRDFALWKLDRGAAAAALATEPQQQQTTEEEEEVVVVGAGAVTTVEGGATQHSSPGWSSPWGHGRPGWHIECSAMAHAIFGRYLALHSGGIDLAFPHHCNEIAQCDAYFGIGGGGGGGSAGDGGGSGCCDAGGGGSSCSAITAAGADMAGGGASDDPGEWCGAFLHTGHLHIAGRKMSKSLKNFITIRQFLDGDDGGEDGGGEGEEDGDGGVGGTTVVTADRAELFRVFCLLHKYSATVHFSPDRMRDATAVRAGLTKAVVSAARALRVEGAERRWGAAEHALAEQLQATREAVRAALGHDFATPAALAALQSLASALRSYLPPASSATAPAPVPPELVLEAARYLARTLQMLGLAQAGGNYACTEVGRAIAELDAAERAAFEPEAGGGRTTSEQGSEGGMPTVGAGSSAAALAGALLQFRADVRAAALQPRSTGSDGGAGGLQQDLLRLCDELRDAALNDAGLEVEDASSGSARAARAPKIRENDKTARAGDSAVAAAAVELYSAHDDDGVPTHDVDGEPLSKAKIKKWLKKRDRKARRAEASQLAAE
jgi:cysteinyl-tRNA synthetase